MRRDRLILLVGSMALAATLAGQTSPSGRSHVEMQKAGGVEKPPAVEVGLGYTYLHANAPPGACQCFSLNGGYGSVTVNASHGFATVGDFSVAHAGNIAPTAQSLTVVNYLFGPRYSWRASSNRFTPYGQVLLGGSTELSSLPRVQNVSAFAFSIGGGVNARLTHRIGWKIFELDWLHSQLPNGVNNRQNDLRIDSGVILRF